MEYEAERDKLEDRCAELFSELQQEKEKLKQQENEEGNENQVRMDLLAEQNDKLEKYISYIEKRNSCPNCAENLENKSSTLNQVGKRQQQRKLNEMKTRAQRALWFLESYGVSLQNLSVSNSNGELLELDLNPANENTRPKSKYEDLTDVDKIKIKEVLFIMDNFCVGDAAYHSLSVECNGLPKSYLIKQCRSSINDLFAIERTSGVNVGAQISFKDELRRKIKEKMETGQKGSFKVKISGDGAKISRISNFIVMSFALLSDDQEIMAVKGNHAFAIVCGKECYENIGNSFRQLFEEINILISQGEIDVDGEKVQLEFFLGGDYKFLLMMMGMNAANANYSCIYCKIHKGERWDMSKPELFFWTNEKKRSLDENKRLCDAKKNNFGCVLTPLLNVELENVRVDELHLLLRITDVLEKNIILSAVRWDLRDDKNKRSNQPKGLHLAALVKAINKCGIPFTVWYKLDGNGKKTNQHDWRSLVGNEKKKLLHLLPEQFNEVLNPDTCNTVKQIWLDFERLYETITTWQPSQQQQDTFFEQASNWVKLFLTLKDREDGYSKGNITPYIHVLVYHLPKFLCDDYGIKKFTGQGVERTNDVVRSTYHNKCNKHDACKDSLLALKRLDCLRKHERKANNYTKHDDVYWRETIFQERRKRQRLSGPSAE